MSENTANLASTRLAQPVGSSGTQMTLESTSIMPQPPYYATITPVGVLPDRNNSEIVRITASFGNTITVERGARSTSAKPFLAGAVVSNSIYKEDVDSRAQVIMHRSFDRVDNVSVPGSYSAQLIPTWQVPIETITGCSYEVMLYTEYVTNGNNSSGELGLQLQANGSAFSYNTMTSPIDQAPRMMVGEFTASGEQTTVELKAISNVARNINVYKGYMRIMRMS